MLRMTGWCQNREGLPGSLSLVALQLRAVDVGASAAFACAPDMDAAGPRRMHCFG
jgi:hypothetical protein